MKIPLRLALAACLLCGLTAHKVLAAEADLYCYNETTNKYVPCTSGVPLATTATISGAISVNSAATATLTLPSLSAGTQNLYENLSGGQFSQPIYGSTIVDIAHGLPIQPQSGALFSLGAGSATIGNVGSLVSALPAGNNLIGRVVVDNGSGAIGSVKILDAGGVNQLSVNGSGQITITNTGFAVNAPLPVGSNLIGGVNLSQIGAGTVVTGGLSGSLGVGGLAAAGATAAGNPLQVGGVYNSAAPTPSTGQMEPLQLDANGRLIINCGTGCAGSGTSTFGAAFPVVGTAIGATDGTNMVALKADGSNSLNVNCVTGCAASGTSANNADTVAAVGTGLGQTQAYPFLWNGTTFDRWYGDKTNGGFVNVKLSALPTGAATSALQTTGNTTLTTINTSLGTINTSLGTINTTLGTPMQNTGGTVGLVAGVASIGTVGLNTGANTIGNVNLNSGSNTIGSVQLLDSGGTNKLGINGSGQITVICASGCSATGGTSLADQAAFTQGSTAFTPMGGFYSTSVSNLTTGQGGALRLTPDRMLYTNLGNVGGAAIALGQTTMSASLPVTIASNQSALPALSAGAAIIGKVGIDQTTPGTTNGVQVNAALPAGTNVIGHVITDTGSTTAVTGTVTVSGSVTQGTSPWIVSGSGTAGSAAAGVVTVQGVTSMTPVQVSQATASSLNAAVVGTGTAGTAAGGVLTVQGAASMTKLLVTPDSVALPANQSVNTAQVNGVTTLTGAGATGTGAQRVVAAQDITTIAGSAPGTAGAASANVVTVQGVASMTKLLVTPDSVALPANQSTNVNQVGGTNVVTGGVAGLMAVGGPVASAGANADNPVKIGGVFNTTQPTVTNGQVVDVQTTARGAQIVATGVDTLNATINAALPAGTAILGKVGIDQTTDVTTNGVEIAPTAGAAAGITPVVSASAEATHVLKAGAGNLYSAYATNLTATAGFLVVLNSTSAPADGAITPLACTPLPANGFASISYSPGPASVYSTGITAVVTSATTCFTKTTGTITAFISGAVK